jgi:hypothetical protein
MFVVVALLPFSSGFHFPFFPLISPCLLKHFKRNERALPPVPQENENENENV